MLHLIDRQKLAYEVALETERLRDKPILRQRAPLAPVYYQQAIEVPRDVRPPAQPYSKDNQPLGVHDDVQLDDGRWARVIHLGEGKVYVGPVPLLPSHQTVTDATWIPANQVTLIRRYDADTDRHLRGEGEAHIGRFAEQLAHLAQSPGTLFAPTVRPEHAPPDPNHQ
jgi:hypothetical protein